MNDSEKNMVAALADMKESHHITGVKVEFEDEGAGFEEAMRLRQIAYAAGVNFTVKIGGCSALNDIYESKAIGADSIVAPMVESAYALKKFVRTVKSVFLQYECRECEKVSLFVNIETATGYNNINEILETPEIKEIEGIVLGRVDMANSVELTRDDVNSNEIYCMANSLAAKALDKGKKFIIGGNVTPDSFEFFRHLPPNSLYAFETRKVIFNAEKMLKDENASQGVFKALGFEIMWLKNKRDSYGAMRGEDAQRLALLEELYVNIGKQAGLAYA